MKGTKRTFAIAVFTLVSCSSPILPAATPTTPSTALRLYATSATLPLAEILTSNYRQYHPALIFETSVNNFDALVDTTQRAPADSPVYFLTNHLPVDSPLWGFPVAQDGIAVISHLDTTAEHLSTEQLRGIYQGQITNWQEVGGADQAIVVFTREDGSGTRYEFEQLVMGNRRTTTAARLAPGSAAMVSSVAAQPGAIGFVSMAYLDSAVQVLTIDGVTPSAQTVQDNSYPLRTTVFVAGLAEPQGEFRAFIGWMQSPEGQRVVAQRYVPLLSQP